MRNPVRVRDLVALAAIAGCVPVAAGAPPPETRQPDTVPELVAVPEPEAPGLERELAAPLVGVMLPISGSPFMRQYATQIEEGVRAVGTSRSG